MKGTLFSADFINDSSNNLRLLELNTDTTITPEEVTNIDWTSFISVLDDNALDTVDIIYKPAIHDRIVTNLSASLAANAPFITQVNLHDEDRGVIYPVTITEAGNNFILRLAYDESAIFDSEYCKVRLNVYRLFNNAGYHHYTTAFYHSSSGFGYYNTLTSSLNPENVPDIAVHDATITFNPIDFYKIGSEVPSESVEDRFNSFILENEDEGKLIEQFHFNTSSLDSNGNLTTIRSVNIVYGSNLDVLPLLTYRISALFDLPATITPEVDLTAYSSKIGDHHFYEFATNYVKVGNRGILSDNKVKMADGSWKYIDNIQVGEEIQSYFISGSPQVESDLEVLNWKYEGKTFPTGSYLTSSVVVYKDTDIISYGSMLEFVVDGDSKFSGVGKSFLTYDSSSNYTSFKSIFDINPETDYFYDANGDLIDIDEVNLYITSDSLLTFVELDVEDTDTYIISGSTAFNSIVSHNAPCFVAGTLITLSDGTTKLIEDVKVNDQVLSYNHESRVTESKPVNHIVSKIVQSTVEVILEDSSSVRCTSDHPLYSPTLGYASYDPVLSLQKYGLKVAQLEVGTSIFKADDSSSPIAQINLINEKVVVYNLHHVEDNHNFYANGVLVHNRCFVAGTEITLADGSIKNIENVVVGEEVLTYNEESGEQEPGVVGDLKKHEVSSVIRLTLDNENIIITTHEHPFFVEDRGWVKAGELEALDVCKKVDGSESLISTVEILEEVHTVYNLLSVSENHNFYANGILVHNK